MTLKTPIRIFDENSVLYDTAATFGRRSFVLGEVVSDRRAPRFNPVEDTTERVVRGLLRTGFVRELRDGGPYEVKGSGGAVLGDELGEISLRVLRADEDEGAFTYTLEVSIPESALERPATRRGRSGGSTTKALPRKGRKYDGSFHGEDDGTWELGGYLDHGDWDAAMSLSLENDGRNLSVDGATEHHAGFRKALREMVQMYPELESFTVRFDGHSIPVRSLLGGSERGLRWESMVFYHGTSSVAAEAILREGLRPRLETNVKPAYGASSSAGAGRTDGVYLTTQIGMAKFAALDASKSKKSVPVILEVRGLNAARVAADEDSRETDPARSLARMGSIAYLGTIPASQIRIAMRLVDNQWRE